MTAASLTRIGAAGLLASGLLLVYAAPLAAMVRQWDASPMYSYAYTVPLISLFLLWSRRDAIGRTPARPSRLLAIPVLLAALAMLVLGHVTAIQLAQQLSFLVALVGVVLLLFGVAHLRIGAPALVYLLFMIPFWDVFTEPLHWPFQNRSAELGVAMLHAAGIPAYRDGTVIALSNITLEVARQCSGVNYLIAVLALALPLAWLRLEGWWRRAALIGSATAIAALANGVRVALIGALAYWEIGSPLHGPFHMLHGLFVAGIGYVALFAGLNILEAQQMTSAGRRAQPAAAPAPAGRVLWRVRDAWALAIVLWTLTIVGTAPGSTPVALAMPLDDFPQHLGAWTTASGTGDTFADPNAWSEADHHLVRFFTRDGQRARVDVWYYESQTQSREIISFRTDGLHRQAVTRGIPLPDGTTFGANLVRLPGEIGVFWYVFDGTPESGQYAAKLRSAWTVLRSGRSNGASVMVRLPFEAPGSDETAALAVLDEVAGHVQAVLAPHWHPETPGARHTVASHPR